MRPPLPPELLGGDAAGGSQLEPGSPQPPHPPMPAMGTLLSPCSFPKSCRWALWGKSLLRLSSFPLPDLPSPPCPWGWAAGGQLGASLWDPLPRASPGRGDPRRQDLGLGFGVSCSWAAGGQQSAAGSAHERAVTEKVIGEGGRRGRKEEGEGEGEESPAASALSVLRLLSLSRRILLQVVIARLEGIMPRHCPELIHVERVLD